MDDNNAGSKKRTLARLLDQPPKVVPTDTEDFFEKTRGLSPEDYSREFEKTVNGHMGFTRISTLKGAGGSMKRAAGSDR